MTSYEVLKNRLTNGRPYTVEAAVARITALADALEITQDQANELTALAQQYGSAASQDTETRLQQLEAASLEHDAALIELAGPDGAAAEYITPAFLRLFSRFQRVFKVSFTFLTRF